MEQSLSFKADWPDARERLRRWWTGQATDRVVALVTAPRRGVTPQPASRRVPEMYTDAATVFQNLDGALDATFFGGEAFPAHWVYLGPVPLSACMGCPKHFEADTVWHSRRFESWDAVEELAFDSANEWYRLLCDLTQASVQRGRGRYLVSGQGFGCVSDVIADLWGSEPTLLAMVERPDAVREAARRLTGYSTQLYDRLNAVTAPLQEGTFDWTHLWAPGRLWTLQSDLCCMISAEMFQDFVLPELRAEAEHADFSLYHLDGPGALKHLDALLSIEALDGIQWVPGAGASRDPLDWLDLFHRVQAAGKKLLIYCPPERVKPLLEKISRRDVCLGIRCSDQTAAENVLAELDHIGM